MRELTVSLLKDEQLDEGEIHMMEFKIDVSSKVISLITLRWRHNDLDGVSDHQPHDCLLNLLFRRRSKKTSKLRVTGLCARNSPWTGEFPAQKTSNAENNPIWWRHHEGKGTLSATIALCKRNRFSFAPHCWPCMRGIHLRWISLTSHHWHFEIAGRRKTTGQLCETFYVCVVVVVKTLLRKQPVEL